MKRSQDILLSYKTILDSFNDLETDDTVAVICGEASVTYRELIPLAKRLALAMGACGIKKGDRIVLSMGFSTDFICAVMAVLYAGAAYVAIDRSWPEERLDYIVQDSKAAMVLTDEKYAQLKKLSEEARGELPEVCESDAIGVYYTSGSTGRPKGVVVSHLEYILIVQVRPENVCYYETARLCRRILCMSNFAYAAAAGDIFFTLYAGMTLVLATDEEKGQASLLGECIRKNQVDGTMGTPSMLIGFLEDPSFSAAFLGLRRVFLIGEPVSVRDGDYIADRTGAALYDAFGASEVGFFAYCKIRRGEPVRLEIPTYGTKLLLLDEEGKEAKTGEICIAGGLPRYNWYLDQELNEKKYPVHPEYGKIYRMGDKGIREPDGTIRMTGRLDVMQKLHGQRLEPREIELAMENYAGIRQAAAAIRGEGKDAVLCAWYTVREAVDEDGLREYLKKKLPAYMVPSRMLRMDSFPLNTSGKLDRRSLPDIEVTGELYEAPKNETEAFICRTVSELLNRRKPVGRHDNLIMLGCDSIRLLQLASVLWTRKNLLYTMADIRDHPTPALLAAARPSGRGAAVSETQSEEEYSRTLPEEIQEIANLPETEAVFPASTFVENYIILKRYGITNANTEQHLKVCLNAEWSEEEFRQRIDALVRVHPSLRSYFVSDRKGKNWQIFRRKGNPVIFYKDIRKLSKEAAQRFINGFWQALSEKTASEEEKPYWKAACFVLGEGKSVLLLLADHTIMDGMSLFVAVNDLCRDLSKEREDAIFAHRRRSLSAAMETPKWPQDYYSHEHGQEMGTVLIDRSRYVPMTLDFSRQETEEMIRYCVREGLMPYTFLQYQFGMALLEQKNKSELWLMTLESGRLAQSSQDLGIVGNLTYQIPIRFSAQLTLMEFVKKLDELRSDIGLPDRSFIPKELYSNAFEGLVSNDFIEFDPLVTVCELIGGHNRAGNSYTMRNGCLSLELRHKDNEADKQQYEALAKVLRRRLTFSDYTG